MLIAPVALPPPSTPAPPGGPLPPPPDPASVSQFAAMLATPAPLTGPTNLLAAQLALARLSLGSDLSAKVAGGLTQAINKLVNLQ